MTKDPVHHVIPIYGSITESRLSLTQEDESFELIGSDNLIMMNEFVDGDYDIIVTSDISGEAIARGIGYDEDLKVSWTPLADGGSAILVYDPTQPGDITDLTLTEEDLGMPGTERSLSFEWDRDQAQKLMDHFSSWVAHRTNDVLVTSLINTLAENKMITVDTIKAIQDRMEVIPGAYIGVSNIDVEAILGASGGELDELTDEDIHSAITEEVETTLKHSSSFVDYETLVGDIVERLINESKLSP